MKSIRVSSPNVRLKFVCNVEASYKSSKNVAKYNNICLYSFGQIFMDKVTPYFKDFKGKTIFNSKSNAPNYVLI